ncbi:universal stress protein [Marivita lacus]|uniref:Universal stress protein n=1 Tax=Marivita lacus TaxID=1323742 RepID=A0ABQ1KI96_9RHOB|nr:universal stress protein [Marivita lacus]MDP4991015.1 universal stress protein [Marivita lacus]GGB95376.1 universal stress protein [Marivita lacus]
MYSKILVPMALDHGVSPQTLEVARVLRSEGGEIVALHVYEAPQGTVKAYLDDEVVKAGFDTARERLNEKIAGLDDVTPALVTGHSARTIIDYAAQHGFDCIVIGSHKPGLSDFFLGSTAARVVRHAPCAVHVHRKGD